MPWTCPLLRRWCDGDLEHDSSSFTVVIRCDMAVTLCTLPGSFTSISTATTKMTRQWPAVNFQHDSSRSTTNSCNKSDAVTATFCSATTAVRKQWCDKDLEHRGAVTLYRQMKLHHSCIEHEIMALAASGCYCTTNNAANTVSSGGSISNSTLTDICDTVVVPFRATDSYVHCTVAAPLAVLKRWYGSGLLQGWAATITMIWQQKYSAGNGSCGIPWPCDGSDSTFPMQSHLVSCGNGISYCCGDQLTDAVALTSWPAPR